VVPHLLVDTPGIFAKKQIVAPFVIAQSLWVKGTHNMGLTTVAKFFFLSIFATVGAVN
jgi:hypothetical protein